MRYSYRRSFRIVVLAIALVSCVLFAWPFPYSGGVVSAQEYFPEKSQFHQTVPSRIVPDEIVVKFKTGVPLPAADDQIFTGIPSIETLITNFEVTRIHKQFGGSRSPAKKSKVDLSTFYAVRFPPKFDPQEVAAEFSLDPNVEYAQVIGIHEVYPTTPNDTSFSTQWALNNTGQTGGTVDADVDAPEAWDLCQGSSSVILAIVDTGVDWQHPDLGGSGPDYVNGNIWINQAEYSGSTGVDDDGNGYIDDIRGWDWVDGETSYYGDDVDTPDNNPMDFNGHGTHCAGIASAITNNSTGVAGLAWGSKVMALRVGWSDRYLGQEVGYVRMDFAAQAIIYATDNGATAINCSWGSSNSGGLKDAVDYALANGVLVVVAAGNDNSSTPDYLGSRGDCIDVAATDDEDIRASFSNYGTWVDVSAPGVSIYNTYYNHTSSSHTYVSLSGTSMAAPHVVGLIGLIKAYEPSLSATEIETAITGSTDNIDGKNPGYGGELGTGRINAYSALSSITRRAYFAYSTHAIDDSGVGGDNSGSADPGETDIQMTVTLINEGSQDATVVSATLSTTDPYITIDNDYSDYPYLDGGGGSGPGDSPYIFDVDSSCPEGHQVTFQLNTTCDEGYSNTDTFVITVGIPPTQPDLTLTGTSDITFSKNYPDVDDIITITATIHNNGASYDDIDTTPFAEVTSTGSSGYRVYVTQWMAQSFTATSDCYLAKVSVEAVDYATDVTDPAQYFKVSIQSNDSGQPSGTDLSSVENHDFSSSSWEWHDFVFSIPAQLASGTKYWIVASSTAPFENRYLWRYEGTTDTYTGGEAKYSSDGVNWSAIPTNEDLCFRTYKYTYNTVISFYDGDPDNGGTQIAADQILPPIAFSSSDTAEVDWTASAGYREIYVAIDQPDSITESDENNNKDFNPISVAPGWDSYSDYPPETGCELFNSSSLSTVYMKGSELLRNHGYKAAYYDDNGVLIKTEIGSSGPFDGVPAGEFRSACDFTNYQGTAVPGTWHAIICESSYSAPPAYEDLEPNQVIADDTFDVTAEAIPEFPTIIAAIAVASLCFGIYYLMRKRRRGYVGLKA